MIRTVDILLDIFLWLIVMVIAFFIFILTDYPFLILVLALLYFLLRIYIKRQRKILRFVEEDFKNLGYLIFDERPLKRSEMEFTAEFNTEIKLNAIPLSRFEYVTKFVRVFKAKSIDEKTYELTAIITQKWNGKNEIKILSRNDS
jgi:hypothetical protein